MCGRIGTVTNPQPSWGAQREWFSKKSGESVAQKLLKKTPQSFEKWIKTEGDESTCPQAGQQLFCCMQGKAF